RDEWNEQVDQQRQQDNEWRKQMKAWHREMEEAGMPQGVAQQQAAPAPNPQAVKIALQQLAAAQGFGVNRVAPKQAAPPVVKANPQPVPPPMTNEERASGKFDMAMMLANAGRSDAAAEYCQFIIKNYAGTKGAAQAQTYLNRPIAQ